MLSSRTLRTALASGAVASALVISGCIGGDSGKTSPPTETTTQAQTQPGAQLPDGYTTQGATKQVFRPNGRPALDSRGHAVLVAPDGKLINPDGKPTTIDPDRVKPAPPPKGAETSEPQSKRVPADQAPTPVPPAMAGEPKFDYPIVWLGEVYAGAAAQIAATPKKSPWGSEGYVASYFDHGKVIATIMGGPSQGAGAAPDGRKLDTPVGPAVVIKAQGDKPAALALIATDTDTPLMVSVTLGDGVAAADVAAALQTR